MVSIMGLPAINARNAGFDLSPINRALEFYTNRKDRQEDNARRDAMMQQNQANADRELTYKREAEERKYNRALEEELRKQKHEEKLYRMRFGSGGRTQAAGGVSSPQQDPYAATGMDEDGNLIFAGYGGDDTLQGQSANDQFRLNFGQSGLTSGDVPGIVTTPDGGSDQFATREKQMQTAMQGASGPDQDRLQRHIATQRMWTQINGSKPPSGHIYAPDGTLIDLKDKSPIDVKAALPRAQQALSLLNKAEETLTSATSIATRGPRVYMNQGEMGQAAKDIQQAGMQIVYLLSGKQTSAAEMKMFMDTYGIDPLDSDWRIKQKVSRVRGMLTGIIEGVKSGLSYDEAFAKSYGESMFDLGGQQNLGDMSDDDLLKALGGS